MRREAYYRGGTRNVAIRRVSVSHRPRDTLPSHPLTTMRRVQRMVSGRFNTGSTQLPGGLSTRLGDVCMRIGERWDARSLYLRDLRYEEGYVYPSDPTYRDLGNVVSCFEGMTPAERARTLDAKVCYMCFRECDVFAAATVIRGADDSRRLVVVLNAFSDPVRSTKSLMMTLAPEATGHSFRIVG